MLAFPAAAFAEEGKLDLGTFTILKEDQKAPFAGFLFDQSGIAKLLAETEFKLLELELKHDFELQKSEALWQLKLDNSAASLTALQEKHTTLLGIKDNEIKFYNIDLLFCIFRVICGSYQKVIIVKVLFN